MTTGSLRHPVFLGQSQPGGSHQKHVYFSSLESPVEERQSLGTISAVVGRQMSDAEEKVGQGRREGEDSMSSWFIIIFGYVIIAVAVFNIATIGTGSHPLF